MPFKAGAIYGEAILNTKKWTTGLDKMQKQTVLGMAVITAAFTAAMLSTGKLVNEWNKELTNVSTLIDTTVISVESLSKELLHLDPQLGNTTELTRGLYQAFSSGARTAEEAMELTTTSAKFGKAALVDTFTAVDVLSTAINAYGKETMTAMHASDVFFTTIKLGKVIGEELASSIGVSIPLFASVGIPLEELTSGLATMTKQGINAHKSTTQLNAIVNSFLKPSKAMIKQLKGVGYESGAAFLATEGLAGALDLIAEASDLDATKIAELVPNIRGMRGVMALTGVGAQEFSYIMNEMSDVMGVNQVAFEKQDKIWDTASNAIHKVGLEVGATSKEFLDNLLKGVTEVSTWLINLSETSKLFASNFIVVGATVGAVTLALIGLKAALVAIAANPIGAAILAFGLLTVGAITLIKTLNDKAIIEAAGRFEDIAESVGVTAENATELGTAMVSLERYFKAQRDNANPYATVLRTQKGMVLQIKRISEELGIMDEELITIALSSESITLEQKKTLRALKFNILEQKEMLKQEKIALEFASGIANKRRVAAAAALDEAEAQALITAALDAEIELLEEKEAAAEAARLAELARIAGVKQARLDAEQGYKDAIDRTNARIDFGLINEKEKLEQNITAGETLVDAIIELGYSHETAGQIGNKTLERTQELLKGQRDALADIIELEEEASKEKLIIYKAASMSQAAIIGARGEDYADYLNKIVEAEWAIADEIIEIHEDKTEKQKKLFTDWFNFLSSGVDSLVSTISAIQDISTQNDLDTITLAYQEQLQALQDSLDDGLISREVYDDELALLDQQRLEDENDIKKASFKANKKWDIGNVWMSAADAIMGYWASSASLGPIAGPIAAGIMTGLTLALAKKQVKAINEQKFVPSMAEGGTGGGATRVNEEGGEILKLPDGTIIIPNDISKQIAHDTGIQNIISISFAGAHISNDMELRKIVDHVNRKLGKQLRGA